MKTGFGLVIIVFALFILYQISSGLWFLLKIVIVGLIIFMAYRLLKKKNIL